MMHVISQLVFLVVFSVQNSYADVACDCPKLACDPCSVEKGITFFSDKCGQQNAKIKSCARPTCIPIEEATKACPVPPLADSGPREPVVVAASTETPRAPAAGIALGAPAGKVKVLSGSVSIIHADGRTSVVAKEAILREGDRVESGKEAGAVINFDGGNKLHVHPESVVELKEFKDHSSPESRKALLKLIKGRVRNEVIQKYNGKTSYYKIETRGATAGVRGTDFLVTFSDEQKLDTKIETLGGTVILSDLEESDRRILTRGDAVSFVAELPTEASVGPPRGKFTDVIKMTPEEMQELDRGSRMDVARVKRKTASVEEMICKKPEGSLNQCMWKQVGERCLRARCNGNGVWAEETRVPASVSHACPAHGAVVRDCDY